MSSRRHLAVASPREVPTASKPELLDDDALLQVGELAKATGKTVRAVHLYESMGLIEPVRRSKGRYRLFAPDTKVRIRWISKLQDLGLSLGDIQAIVEKRAASESARLAAEELRGVYDQKLAEVREQIHRFQALAHELEASLQFLRSCEQACDAGVSTASCSQCDRHHEPEPRGLDLIVGAQLR